MCGKRPLPPFTGEVPNGVRRWGLTGAAVWFCRQKPCRIFRRIQNGFENTIHIVMDFRVPEPQHHPSLVSQKRIALRVMGAEFVEAVLLSVAFDDEHGVDAGEVCDVRTDRMLTAEAKAAKLFIAQPHPQAPLRFGHGLAQRACVSVGSADRHG